METAAVIFDMDGVIVDSEPLHERAFRETLAALGYGESHGLNFRDHVGRSDDELWKDFLRVHRPGLGLEELLALKRRRLLELLRIHQPLFPGAVRLIRRLHGRVPLALASGSERPVIEAVLDLGQLRPCFAVTVSASEVPRGKPAPDIFLHAARALGVKPERCWVIEDSLPGIAAARAAGMRVVAIPNTHPTEALRDADCVVQDYECLDSILRLEPNESP